MKLSSDKLLIVGFVVVAALIVGVAIFAFSGKGQGQVSQTSTSDLVDTSGNILGSKDAKVKIVEFADFQCPACKASFPIVRQVASEYGNKILINYRYFPLISEHQYALKSAEAAQAAAAQGKFWEYADLLFANQENLDNTNLVKFAGQIGLNTKKFEADLNSDKYKDKVMADLNLGETVGVQATPTFFINGTKYEGVLTIDQFRQIINNELTK